MNFFVSVATNLVEQQYPEPDNDRPERRPRETGATNDDHTSADPHPFDIPPVTVEYVRNEIRKMPVGKATGLDGISVKMLKLSCNVVSPLITWIMNLSISTNKFPSVWKRAKVCPIFKSGSKGDVNNYRPISILPAVSKLLERHVHDKLYEFLMSKALISAHQSGFRPLHSTVSALTKFHDCLLKNINAGEVTGVVYLDLKKAFDTVNHDRLLSKMKTFNVHDTSISWFKSYLGNRTQIVSFNGYCSEPLPISIGVPQGSILGPLMFLMFINDLPLAVENSQIELFADDTTIYLSDKDTSVIERKLGDDMERVYTWLKTNRLIANVEKTKFQLIGSPHKIARVNTLINISMGGLPLEHVSTAKMLGVHFDSTLNWEHHINALCSKIRQRLGLLKRLSIFHDEKRNLLTAVVVVVAVDRDIDRRKERD